MTPEHQETLSTLEAATRRLEAVLRFYSHGVNTNDQIKRMIETHPELSRAKDNLRRNGVKI